MTKPIAFGFLCFCVTLAVLIGQRLSDQAMAVIVGSVIGVVASMPMAALILFIWPDSARRAHIRHQPRGAIMRRLTMRRA